MRSTNELRVTNEKQNLKLNDMIFENFENYEDVVKYMIEMTGHPYLFAVAKERKWGSNSKIEEGEFFQLMPAKFDTGFFYWYCEKRPYHQFFKSKEMCVLHFLKYHQDWVKDGSPDSLLRTFDDSADT